MHEDRQRLIAYGGAHGGKSLFWHAAELLFGYVLTEAWQMPPLDAGRVLAVSMALSAVLDIVAARFLTRWGLGVRQAGQVQAWATLACGAAFVAFGLSGLLPPFAHGALAVAGVVCFRLAYVFIDVPQNALLAMLTLDDRERTALASTRYVTGGVAAMLVTGVLAPLLVHEKASARAIFACFTVAVSLVATLTAMLLRRHLDARIPEVGGAAVPLTSPPAMSPTRYGMQPSRMLAAMFVVSAGTSLFGRLEVYFVASSDQGHVAYLLLAIAAGTAISQPAWVWLSRRTTLAGMLRIAAGAMLASVLVFRGVAAQGGDALLLAGFVYGSACGGVLLGLWSLAAGMAAERATRVAPATTMAWLTFTAKLGLAASALASGWVLHGSDYHAANNHGVLQAMTGAVIVGALACLTVKTRRHALAI
ncbi:MFS transporter [Xanthomonas sp. NCPPB 2632]|uniref:MFS transporter n=1 Tax=Xanthomonas sp. NCPPB 2632 TaxID=3240912 RepID=UPI0035159071